MLVQWQSIEPNEATWQEFQQVYPQLNLEGKVAGKGKSIITSEVNDMEKTVAKRGHMKEEPPKRNMSKNLKSPIKNVLIRGFVQSWAWYGSPLCLPVDFFLNSILS